jgi:hypothetical protein
MSTIEVACDRVGDGWTCRVTVADATGRGEHRVGVRDADLGRLAPGDAGPEDLVRRSFEFMLEREPRTSILSTFELPLIGRYFPEYEAQITRDH